MSEKPEQNDSLEGLLVTILGIMIVLGGAAAIYFWLAGSTPNEVGSYEWNVDQFSKWVWTIFGIFFFLYGAVGVMREKIGVGWRTGFTQTSTILEGAGAFTAGMGTAVGGLLMLGIPAVYFLPSLGTMFHPAASLIAGFAAIIVSWICGFVIRTLGY